MEFSVKIYSGGQFAELIISAGDKRMNGGLLNTKERTSLARNLADCIVDLVKEDSTAYWVARGLCAAMDKEGE